MVNNDADATSFLLTNACLLEFSKREPSALANLPVVAYSLGTDSGAEEGERTDTKLGGFGLTSLTTAELAAGLVEPGADTALPVLAKVVLMEDCRRAVSLHMFLSHFFQEKKRTVIVCKPHRYV